MLTQFPKSLSCHLTAPLREPHDRELEQPFTNTHSHKHTICTATDKNTLTNALVPLYPNSCLSYLCKAFIPEVAALAVCLPKDSKAKI